MNISVNLDNLSLSGYAYIEADGLGLDVPAWISDEDSITLGEIASILQGGCDGAAYMPTVTYTTANDTMHEHGDDVLDYIESVLGELPACTGESWKGIAVYYLSYAVELWCSIIEEEALDELGQVVEDEVQAVRDMWPDILQMVVDQYGEGDTIAVREAFNDWTDSLCKDGIISDYVYNNIDLDDIE